MQRKGKRVGESRGQGGAGRTLYRRREPTATALYPIVQHHLETFLAEVAEADPAGEGVPGWVEDDFRAWLRCILAWGFARVRCDACAAERLVAFSCKGRGVCPSCNARRMVDVAAHSSPASTRSSPSFPDCGDDVRILAFLTEPGPVPDLDDVDPDRGA